jgi:hypothetical protein
MKKNFEGVGLNLEVLTWSSWEEREKKNSC